MAERTKPDLELNLSRTEGFPVIRKHPGTPSADLDFLNACLGGPIQAELARRGYDLHTIRFSIRKPKS